MKNHDQEPDAPDRELSAEDELEALRLQALLDPSSLGPEESERLEALADPELALFLEDVRALRDDAVASSERAGREVAASVLARTTRHDPSWRGDWQLMRRFLGQRWQRSGWVRLAAASLVLHVGALSVLAFQMLRPEPEPHFIARTARPAVSAFPEASEEQPEPIAVEELTYEEPVVETLRQRELEIENSRAWARHHLALGAPAPDTQADSSTDASRVLAARSRYLTDPGTTPEFRASDEYDDIVVEVLVAEFELDRVALEGRVPVQLPARLARFADHVRRGSDARVLAAAASLERAREYGVLDHAPALADLALDAELQPLAERLWRPSTTRGGAPLDSAWIALLDELCGDTLRQDSCGQAWLAWRSE